MEERSRCNRSRYRFALHLVQVFLFFLLFPLARAYAADAATPPDVFTTPPSEIVVQYKRPSWYVAPQTPGRETIHIEDSTYETVTIPAGTSVAELMQRFESDPFVVSVEVNQRRYITATPDDPNFSLQWFLDETTGIRAPSAWDVQKGSSQVVIAVVDTGVDVDHPDLEGNMWVNPDEIAGNSIDDDGNGYIDDVHGVDLVEDDGDPTPDPDGADNDNFGGADNGTEHGTHVAGIIASVGNNSVGGAGVAWAISLMGVRTLDDEGAGSDTDIAEGIQYAADNGANIINMSLGGYGTTDVLAAAIQYAIDRGVTVVAAAGNDGININKFSFYPACYDGVIGVASLNQSQQASSFSNYGSECVDIAAPGEQIYSTLYTGDPATGFTTDYGYLSGTSMATPVVAGVAALLQSQELTLERQQLVNILLATATDLGLGENYGTGEVDASAAVENIQIANYPQAPTTIQAFADADQGTEYAEEERTIDVTPYFSWQGSTGTYDITGYYVYFGTSRSANPVTEGALQTETTFSPTISTEGNNVSYYLRIAATDVEGQTSVDVASFEYAYDTLVKQPKGIQVGKHGNGVQVRWDKVKNDHVTHYRVLRDAKAIGIVAHPLHRYIDTTVVPGAKYDYSVQAVDDLKHRHESNTKTIRFTPQERIVIAAGAGGGPQVRIYNVAAQKYEQTWYAFDATDRSGLEVAVGNMDEDGRDEIIVSRGSAGSPTVRVFNGNGKQIGGFTAYESSFTGGVRVAAGNMDDDAQEEVIVVPGPGRLPLVKIVNTNGKEVRSFLAMDKKWSRGMYVAAMNWDGKGTEEIAVTPDVSGPGIVYIYSAEGKLIHSFTTGYADDHSGLRLSTLTQQDTDREAVLTVPVRGQAIVKRFAQQRGVAKLVHQGFQGFAATYTAGGTITAGDVIQQGQDRVIVGSNGGRTAIVNVYNLTGGFLQTTIQPFGSFQGAVTVAAGWF